MNEPNIGTPWRDLIIIIQQLVRGRSNAVGSFTLTANAATTDVAVDKRVANTKGHPTLTAKTANASAEVGNGTIYVSAVTTSGFTITHANNAQTDREFYYEFRGG